MNSVKERLLKHLVRFFKHSLGSNQRGFSLFEVVIALTIIVILGTVIQLNYRNYKDDVVKDMHLLNSVQYITSLQNALLKGSFVEPESGQTLTIDLGQLRSAESTIDLSDPSADQGFEYDDSSYIQVYNNNGTLEYYINLKRDAEDHYYIDTASKQSNSRGSKLNHLIEADVDVTLPD